MDLTAQIKNFDLMPQAATWKVLLKGLSKTGKTYLMSTFPLPFVIDTDHSLKGMNRYDIPTLPLYVADVQARKINVYETVVDAIRALRDKRPPFDKIVVKTLCIDGLTSLANLMVLEAMLDSKVGKIVRDPAYDKATYDEYGVLEHRLLTAIMPLIDDLGINFCATAGLKLDVEETKSTNMVFPDIVGGSRYHIEHRFDAVIYTTADHGKYFANCQGTFKVPGGIRNWVGKDVIEQPTFDKIFNPANFRKAV